MPEEVAATVATPGPGDGPPPVAPEAKATPAPEKPAETKKDSTEPPAKVVPEKYDLKIPEGSFIDAKDLEKIAAIARERGFSQQEAEAFLNTEHKAYVERVDRRSQAWLQEVQDDKEIGGSAFKENVALASRIIDRFGSERLKTELNQSGFGNHPEIVRLFVKLGRQFADDKAVFPGTPSSGKVDKSLEETLYPTMFRKEA